ncbi:MAG TPA: 50S ribosomal protein L29 [Acidimicrobiales bacterium]|nr:50S ribosomal protein L29 [Acidimicrobiales bacterium]
MTKPAELRKLNDDELSQHLAECREEVFHLRFQLAMGKQDNSSRLSHVRRELARLLTLERERELAGPATGASSLGAPAGPVGLVRGRKGR